jgi:hypothetical protein
MAERRPADCSKRVAAKRPKRRNLCFEGPETGNDIPSRDRVWSKPAHATHLWCLHAELVDSIIVFSIVRDEPIVSLDLQRGLPRAGCHVMHLYNA